MSDFDPVKSVQKLLLGHISVLMITLRQANSRLTALITLLHQKGLVTYDEWQARVKEIEAGMAAEEATDPRMLILEDLYNRLARGEEVPADEFNRLMREALDQPLET